MPIHVTLCLNDNVRKVKVYDYLASEVPIVNDASYDPNNDPPDKSLLELDSVKQDDCYSPPRGVLKVKGEVQLGPDQWAEQADPPFAVKEGDTCYWPHRDAGPLQPPEKAEREAREAE